MPPVPSLRRPSASRAPSPATRRRIAGVLGVLLAVWVAAASILTGIDFVARLVGPPQPLGVTAWSPGEYASTRLADLLAEVEPRVPAGRVVVFSAPSAGAEEELFLSLWGAYHLPRHRVIRARHPAAGVGEYLVVYDGTAPVAAGEELLRHPAGTLHRLPVDSR